MSSECNQCGENTLECLCSKKPKFRKWKGFKFSMGFFLVWNGEKFRIGKCDPITKEVIEWYEVK